MTGEMPVRAPLVLAPAMNARRQRGAGAADADAAFGLERSWRLEARHRPVPSSYNDGTPAGREHARHFG